MRRVAVIIGLVAFGAGYYLGAKQMSGYSKRVLEQALYDMAFSEIINRTNQIASEAESDDC